VKSVLFAEKVDIADLILVADTVATIGDIDQFRPEGATDELCRIFVTIRLPLDETSNRGPMRRV